MKFVIVMTVAAVLLSGCQGAIQRQQAHWNGHAVVCVDGVTYLQFPTGTVAKRTLNDKLIPCT